MKRKICVVTGSRAEYGLLKPLLEEIRSDRDLRLQLVVTGTHLSPKHGLTYKEIENDGFNIDSKVDITLVSDSPEGVSRSMGLAMSGFAGAFKKLSPDIVVVLGDRFEIFSAVAAAVVRRTPVAHISGGELTEGVLDDYFRHAITKMSHLHFTATDEYRKRVIQLGEEPKRVFNVGELGLDSIRTLPLLSKERLEEEIDFTFGERNLMVTFHPATLEDDTSGRQFKDLLEVLDGLDRTKMIFTKANADTGGRAINSMIDGYVLKHPCKCAAFTSMGHLRYLSALQFVDAVVGNSSSGIAEAPSFRIGTINIGDRQKGRLRCASIIDCAADKGSIARAIRKLYSADFQKKLGTVRNIYGGGRSAQRIKDRLKKVGLERIVKKRFYDIGVKI